MLYVHLALQCQSQALQTVFDLTQSILDILASRYTSQLGTEGRTDLHSLATSSVNLHTLNAAEDQSAADGWAWRKADSPDGQP